MPLFKTLKPILISLIFTLCISSTVCSQSQADTILFLDSTELLPNPRLTEIDSARIRFSEGLKILYDSGFTSISTSEVINPSLFYINSKGDTLSFNEQIISLTLRKIES